MNPDRFLVIQPVPHWLYDDQPFMWNALEQIWTSKLADDGGIRTPGPLYMREMQLGEIAGSSLAEHLLTAPDVAAVFRVVGPALPPQDMAIIRGIEHVTGETYDQATDTWHKQ
jgi:hypothetical protein